jgi:hypothetical protein
MFWFTPAGQRGPLRASRPRWPASVGAWCCWARDGPSWAGRAFRVTVVVPVVRNAMVRAATRREAPWRRPLRRAGTEALGQRLGTAHAGITRLRPKSFRCQLTRALGLQITADMGGLAASDLCRGNASDPDDLRGRRHQRGLWQVAGEVAIFLKRRAMP